MNGTLLVSVGLDASREHVWLRIRHLVAELRASLYYSTYAKNSARQLLGVSQRLTCLHPCLWGQEFRWFDPFSTTTSISEVVDAIVLHVTVLEVGVSVAYSNFLECRSEFFGLENGKVESFPSGWHSLILHVLNLIVLLLDIVVSRWNNLWKMLSGKREMQRTCS